MKVDFEQVKNRELYIWGNGNLFNRYRRILNDILIIAIIDKDEKKRKADSNHREPKCISPLEASPEYPVIIAVEDPVAIKEISNDLDERGFLWCHIVEAVDSVFLNSFNRIASEKVEDDSNSKMKMFIDVMLPVTNCNFECSYCYLTQNKVDNRHLPLVYHNEKFIRYSLRKERIGGTAFINICGIGETLLCKELIPIIKELIDEGHYVQIVTNATNTKAIKEISESSIDPEHLFFKCSLHWKELNKRKLLNTYACNVNLLRLKGISISVELVPDDDIVEDIPKIKEYCMDNFGALPHVTVTRDESKKGFPIITSYSEEEYIKIWSEFESPMFDFKIRNRNRYKNCYAGLWSAELNLATGELYKCTGNPRICNIYENPNDDIPFEQVGEKCSLPYCFNCHAYLTLGLVPEVNAPSYLEMRDRATITGEYWIKGKIKDIFKQKLYDNHKVIDNKRENE